MSEDFLAELRLSSEDIMRPPVVIFLDMTSVIFPRCKLAHTMSREERMASCVRGNAMTSPALYVLIYKEGSAMHVETM